MKLPDIINRLCVDFFCFNWSLSGYVMMMKCCTCWISIHIKVNAITASKLREEARNGARIVLNKQSRACGELPFSWKPQANPLTFLGIWELFLKLCMHLVFLECLLCWVPQKCGFSYVIKSPLQLLCTSMRSYPWLILKTQALLLYIWENAWGAQRCSLMALDKLADALLLPSVPLPASASNIDRKCMHALLHLQKNS